ncbi:hypothetical protein PCANC_18128 [Puccinia coronata f. sp. avenae]|uniref:Trimethylguanosine synthase n=1 Tax=Puccinia coronata f. sp. avenae TaxID=200324 RepID=A0A2N5T346_9BASI|nr:hypothetical protein PCANC_18128 [Puccinia coronata f. sp. avenae]PLW19896.1 hypothetical protein PCASD_13842 [Puccinia coronata f. sp. avenae]
MRILTYAVRKAMALAATQPSQQQDSEEHTIACANTSDHEQERTAKRARLDHDDDVGEEPFYLSQDDLPAGMTKYWAQRRRLFSKFDEGIKMDKESWYSVTPEAIAKQTAARARCKVIVDGFCGAGGNAIQFAFTCDKVIAIDKDPNKIKLARSNAAVYGVAHKIEFICADFLGWMAQLSSAQIASIDVVFLSPPWGGMDYLKPSGPNVSDSGHYYKLNQLEPIDGFELFKRARKVTERIIFYLPRHMDLKDLARLAHLLPPSSDNPHPHFAMEVEENWMNEKCKALTVYFGSLVSNPSPPSP